MKVAVVGLGYWGPNLVRNFLSTVGVEGVVCCDILESRLEKIRSQFHGIEVSSSYDEILRREDIGAVVLATPVSDHYPLGMKALYAGKHLLVEKPLTLRSNHAEDLVRLAARRGLTLMVDHTFIYTSAVRKIKEYIDRGDIGDILYFDSVRVNLGLFQRDTNVVWDLAPHDLSIMDYLIGKEPLTLSAVGMGHFGDQEDIAYLSITFADNIIAHFHVNWISPVKLRKILIGGTKLMVVYDDMEPSEKVKMYNRGVDLNGKESEYKALVDYRIGDMYAPHVDQREALSLMVEDFIGSIRTGREPLASGRSGLNVVRILEAAEMSIKSGGRQISFSNDRGISPLVSELITVDISSSRQPELQSPAGGIRMTNQINLFHEKEV